MKTESEFAELRDVAQGDFAISNGTLLYKGQQVAGEGKVIFTSSEEVFFLFEVENEEVKEEFTKVVFLNFRQCRFYKCKDVLPSSRYLQFTTPSGENHAFRLIDYNGGPTKAVCSNFQNFY